MAIIDTIEYSVCEDCLVSIAHGCNDSTSVADDDHLEARMKAELCGRKGHFVAGVEPTEDDEEGAGYEEFSRSSCELCNDTRGGSRHGVTLLIEEEEVVSYSKAKCNFYNNFKPNIEVVLKADWFAAITYGSNLRVAPKGEDQMVVVNTLPEKILITPESSDHRVWLNLWHGRKTVEEELQEWGFDHSSAEGYTAPPVADAVIFLTDSVNMITYKEDGSWTELVIPLVKGMVFYEGNYYGDYSVDNDGSRHGQKAEQDGLSPAAGTTDAATAEPPAADPAAVIPPTDQGA